MSEPAMKDLREEIDRIDRDLISLLARRMNLGPRVAATKEANDLPIIIPDRVRAVVESRTDMGKAAGLSPDFVRDIFNRIIWEMCQQEARALRDPPNQS